MSEQAINKEYLDAVLAELERTRRKREQLEQLLSDTMKLVTNQATLRDQFAMAALTGIFASDIKNNIEADLGCKYAWEIADVMLKQHEVTK